LGWALIFFLAATHAAHLGVFSVAGLAATIAKVLLVVFVILLVFGGVANAIGGWSPISQIRQEPILA
jgi:uncharacterized membrane protein YtjA (UPF0391 family)